MNKSCRGEKPHLDMPKAKAPKLPGQGAPQNLINAIVLRSATTNQVSTRISPLTHLIEQQRLTDCLELLENAAWTSSWQSLMQQSGGAE
ncbi:hypothetical protein [Scytonema sp. PCC 10023]|uniref:hypothetical protein n=1 Tax=Scytonema sp. PCC 10023 TaxID=1680591 RepID=UPI0039C62B21